MGQPKEERTVEIIVNGQKAFASLKEMNAAAAVLYSQFQKMSGDDPGRKKLVADYQGLKGKIADVKTELTGVSQGAGVMKQAFANAFAIFTGGGILGVVQQIFGFLSSSREEFLQSAKSGADLEATLKSTAHAAGLTAAEIQKIGTERAKVTLFDDDETNRASAMLLTFTNIKKGVFEQAIPAIQDLATKMGGDGPADLKGASVQVGKALNDPMNGLKALTRVGVTFTEQQKEQITAMQKAGNTAGAQKLILAELNKEFGGSAEAARKAGGGVATLQMAFNEFKETVGGKVSEVLNMFSDWLGRVLKLASPLVDMLSSIGQEFINYYREIGDVLEGLGLFNDKTDTAAMVVSVLKTTLTLMLIPLRTMLRAAKGVVDLFIEWYNKSELLRGILGGLGAVIVTLFTTIKDDAIKILGGVGDIIIGIFTLDKNKIAAGFKSALGATADLALEAGNKAAAAFAKGYEANKNNKIVRKPDAPDAPEEKKYDWDKFKMGDEAAAGKSEKEKKADLAKLKKLQDAADQERLTALKHWAEVEQHLEDARIAAIADKREREIAQINLDAKRKGQLVVGSVAEQTAQLLAINEERERKLQELAAKYQKEADDDQKKTFEQELADEEANEVEREAVFQDNFEKALISAQARDKAIYDSKKASLQAELLLAEQYGGKQSAAYRKTYKDIEKLDKDYNASSLAEKKKLQQEKAAIEKLGLSVAGDVVQTTIDILFKDEEARKKHHNLYTALAGAKIIIQGVQEVAAIWEYSAEQPENALTAGLFGTVLAGIQTAVAVARTGYALSQLQEFSFAKGGRTGAGMLLGGQAAAPGGTVVSPMGQLMEMSGMRVGSNGKLIDDSGFAVAGIVHQDEYVVPAWMRKDPEVAAVENWLEARRLRGFADGGATSGPVSTLPVPNPVPETDGDLAYAVQTQMLAALRELTQQLADVHTWQRELTVQQNLQEVEKGLNTLKQVKHDSAIRA
ncbi:hypothetical protein [Hymenobacter terricola]|uniref:hypothetical protein n=1 Tax=Hymenobacter terricola TaxID=2819236 RepID=UPI001B3024E0|nr:hypothetical protein [Hymenobacter terricola]